MAAKKVISRKNLPSKIPVIPSLVLWLVMERLNSPGWLYGALGAVMGLVLLASVIAVFQEKETVIL